MRASVVIPAHNAEETLLRTLEAVVAQDLEEPFEVIVVDDRSTDGTGLVAAAVPGVRLVPNGSKPGAAGARNAGVAAASGRLLAFTDADCYPRPDWLRQGLQGLEHADLVQGSVRPDPAVAPQPFDRTLWVVAAVGLFEAANLFIRRSGFDRVGGFEDLLPGQPGRPMAEDAWLGWRLRRSGGRTAFRADSVVHHHVFRGTLRSHLAERIRLGAFPEIVKRIPELRQELLFANLFLNRRTARVDMALAGMLGALALRRPEPLVLAAPWLRDVYASARPWGRRAPIAAIGEAAGDLVGAGALVRGSLRRRSPVL